MFVASHNTFLWNRLLAKIAHSLLRLIANVYYMLNYILGGLSPGCWLADSRGISDHIPRVWQNIYFYSSITLVHCFFPNLVSSLQLPNGLRRQRSSHVSSETCQTTFLNTRQLNSEASRTNALEETPFNWRPRAACRHPSRHKSMMSQVKPPWPNPPLTRTTLCQLCASRSQPVVIQPRSVVMTLALRCSVLDRCPTREALVTNL